MKSYKTITDSQIDESIKPIVDILIQHGFKTFESCSGGQGHAFYEPTIRFKGNEFDLIRAYEICMMYGFQPLEVKRVYRKVDLWDNIEQKYKGSSPIWDKPFNEIIFRV